MAEKAIKFPNRACPKCGKAIHIRAKGHECGWNAEAQTANGAKTKPAKPAASQGTNGKISKMEAVRRVLGSSGNDTMPAEIQDQVKKRFNLKMDLATVSNYKSTILKAGKRKSAGRKPGRPRATQAPVKTTASGSISIADIQAVKELADRIGLEKLQQLAEVLA